MSKDQDGKTVVHLRQGPPPIPNFVDHRMASAFRDLEGDVCDLSRMSDLVELAEDDTELRNFTLSLLDKTIRDLKEKYYDTLKAATAPDGGGIFDPL